MKVRLALVLVATLLFLGVALWGMDLGAVGRALSEISWWVALPMWATYLMVHSLRVFRLRLLLPKAEAARIPFRRLFWVSCVGFLAINVLPLRLGEMVRPYLLVERDGADLGATLAAILVERLLDLCALLTMLLGLGLFIELPTEGIQVGGVDILKVAQRVFGTSVALGICGGASVLFAGDRVRPLFLRLPLGARIWSVVERFRSGLIGLAAEPARGGAAVLSTIGVWFLSISSVWMLLQAFPRLPHEWGTAWSTWTVTLAGMAAIPTPGFVGPFELCCTAALRLWGAEVDLARTFALVLHAIQFSFTLGIGIAGLLAEGLGLRQLMTKAPNLMGLPPTPTR
jgi:uncharacterized membrane protein YbhN (UPF0104 family)